mgnify:CR=1 FL=1
MDNQAPSFFDVYVSLVRSPEEEINVREFANLIQVSYEDLVEDLLFDKEYDGICDCEFEDPEDPTLDEIDECPCIPVLTRKESVKVNRIENDTVFMSSRELASALMEMENTAGEEIRVGAMDLVTVVIEDKLGVSPENQMEMLETAIAHCTEDDQTPLESLLDNTLEQLRGQLDQKP